MAVPGGQAEGWDGEGHTGYVSYFWGVGWWVHGYHYFKNENKIIQSNR